MNSLINMALRQFDQLGAHLDTYGIARNINRHQVAAFLLTEQKRAEGEIDSLKARIDFRRVQAERIVEKAGKTARSGINLALWPARFTLSSLRGPAGPAS